MTSNPLYLGRDSTTCCPSPLVGRAGPGHPWPAAALIVFPTANTHSQVPGLGRQVSGSGIRHQVQVLVRVPLSSLLHLCTRLRRSCTFALHARTRTRQPEPDTRSPETRDPKMSCPPPATRGCHPPPETLSLSGPPVREPSCPHHRLYSILHTRYSRMPPLHLCTGAPLRFAPLHGIFASLVPSSLPALVTS